MLNRNICENKRKTLVSSPTVSHLWIGVFCTRGWRPSKRTPPNNRIYTICEKLNKTAMWIIPLGSNSAIPFISSRVSSLCYLVEGRSDWLVSSELDSQYYSLVARWSNETQCYTLIPNFCLDRPFGFSVHRDTLFLPKLPFQVFDLPGVQYFLYIPNFFLNPFSSSGCPYFCLGQST